MDVIHDEDEVTREPFEDQNGGFEDGEEDEEQGDDGPMAPWKQPKYDDHDDDDDDNNYHDNRPHRDRRTRDMSIEQMDAQERDEDDLSSVDQDDIKFANSFGIQLTGSKSQAAAYKRLMDSDYIATSDRKQGARSGGDATGANEDDQGPRIETSVTSDCIYHKGTFYQRGDIVALCDQDDGQLYFAQLTGFLQDQYCEKSATINWLVPTRPTSRDHFEPQAYRIGLEDVQLRKLDCMTFVRHCPHDYYIRKFFHPTTTTTTTAATAEQLPGPAVARPDKGSYIWTSLDVCKAPVIQRGRAR